jgi:flagellar motor protein MotB
MMHRRIGRRAALVTLLAPTLLASAKAWAGPYSAERNAEELTLRLQNRLAEHIAAGQVTLVGLPQGAQVTMMDAALFPIGQTQLSAAGRNVLSRVIQGLLAPNLMRISIDGLTSSPFTLRELRAQAVGQFFVDFWLGLPMLAAERAEGGPNAVQVPPPPTSGQSITFGVLPG